MDSIIINQKKLQRVLFRAFSDQLQIDGKMVCSSHDDGAFSWWLADSNGNRLSPNWEIPRQPMQRSARWEHDNSYLMESMSPDLIISFFNSEFVRFKELIISGRPIKVEPK